MAINPFTPVGSLFSRCRPSTVTRLVMTAILRPVAAFYGAGGADRLGGHRVSSGVMWPGGTLVAATLFALIIALAWPNKASEASHFVYLPLVPNTPLIQNVFQDGEATWCVDARAAAYPNFVAQLTQTNNAAFNKLGVAHRQVPFGPGCEVRHTMPDVFPCGSGAAACIYYANFPVIVAYKYTLGFTDWRSAQGHEGTNGGHAMGLHEQYKDSGGTIGCDNGYQAMINRLGYETTMSCGTSVWAMTDWDRDRLCELFGVPGERFAACAPEPVCEGTGTWWNACVGRWYFADLWSYAPDTQSYWNPAGVPEWMNCVSWATTTEPNRRGCWNDVIQVWAATGAVLYGVEDGFWRRAP